jgi:hypothetical protein
MTPEAVCVLGSALKAGTGIEHGLDPVDVALGRLRIPREDPGVRLGGSFDDTALRGGAI